MLLTLGADATITDQDKRTPLMDIAARNRISEEEQERYIEIMEQLIKRVLI